MRERLGIWNTVNYMETESAPILVRIERNDYLVTISRATYATALITSVGVAANEVGLDSNSHFTAGVVLCGIVAYAISQVSIFGSLKLRYLNIGLFAALFCCMAIAPAASIAATASGIFVSAFAIRQTTVRASLNSFLLKQLDSMAIVR